MTIQIDMDIPKNCEDCRLKWESYEGCMYCAITAEGIDKYNVIRPHFCPLKEVK